MIPQVPGLSRAEVEIGLFMNMHRIEARRIVQQAMSIGVAIDPASGADVMKAAGMESAAERVEFEQWKQRGSSRVMRNG